MAVHRALSSCLIFMIWILTISAEKSANNEMINEYGGDLDRKLPIQNEDLVLRLIDQNNQKPDLSAENEHLKQILKRQIDKYRYFGGLGKRSDDDYDSDDLFPSQHKRKIDQYRYFGGLGKRFDVESKYENGPKVPRFNKRFDRMKYFGAIGKRSVLSNPLHRYFSYYGVN